MHKWSWLTSRLRHIGRVIGRVWGIILTAWGFLGFLLFLRDVLVPSPTRDALDSYTLVHLFSLRVWLLVGLVLLVLALIEGSFRLDRHRQTDLEKKEKRLKEIESAAPEVTVAVSDDGYDLVVGNRRGPAMFEAKLLVQRLETGPPWYLSMNTKPIGRTSVIQVKP